VKDNAALIILGMHRSGTSLLTGLLGQVGVRMGRSLYAPQKGVNEKGFWEHEDIVDTHDELLLHLRSQWDDLLPLKDKWWEDEAVQPYVARLQSFVKRDFSEAAVWALKDPRMCRLLPLWIPIFEVRQIRPVFICMNRNPFEVIASLQKRDRFSREKALVLWLSHTLSAESYSRGRSRIFIDFDQVVADPVRVLQTIEQETGIAFPISVNQANEKIGRFVSPDLRHHKVDKTSAGAIRYEQGLEGMAYELYSALSEKAAESGGPHSGNLNERIDSIAADFASYQKKWNPELIEQIRYLNQEHADYRIKFFRIYRSLSWLLVKPFWLIEKVLRKY
jgi:hypothetical protein